jgi:hypothetical protein
MDEIKASPVTQLLQAEHNDNLVNKEMSASITREELVGFLSSHNQVTTVTKAEDLSR